MERTPEQNQAQAEVERLLYKMNQAQRIMLLNKLIVADPERALNITRNMLEN